MRQFLTVFGFELKGYLKNKVFIIVTVLIIAAIAVGVFIPNIIAAAGGGGEGERPVMAVYSEDGALSQAAGGYFAAAFGDYSVVAKTGGEEEAKQSVLEGGAECAFVLHSLSSYTYFVENLSMYDTNAAVAEGVLREVYRLSAMVAGGLTPEQAGEIMSVQITGTITALGKVQLQNFFYTYIMIFALYTVILLYGQMVATSVATEKSSRAMELLITSAKPINMIFGKVLASCTAGFIQLVAVFGSALALFNLNKGALAGNAILQSLFDIPIDLFVYMLAFFVLGFLIYAFLYGALGSTTSRLEDINTAVLPVTFLFVAAFLVVVFSMTSGNVNNMALKVCSYIPFTSPMAMFTRIAMTTVAWYEIAISLSVLVLSVVAIGFAAAKIYSAGVLMYGQNPLHRLFGKK